MDGKLDASGFRSFGNEWLGKLQSCRAIDIAQPMAISCCHAQAAIRFAFQTNGAKVVACLIGRSRETRPRGHTVEFGNCDAPSPCARLYGPYGRNSVRIPTLNLDAQIAEFQPNPEIG